MQNNVLVDDTGRAILCDFGMSVALDFTPTGFTTSIVGGATRYLAPELMEPVPRTLAGDIYAFGCISLQVRGLIHCPTHIPNDQYFRY